MLDTIKFELEAPILEPNRFDRHILAAQRIRLTAAPGNTVLTRVECSLPKLLYGHNGRLITSQDELDRGLELLHGALAKVASVPELGLWVPSRCDLVWQVEGLQAGKVIDVLATFRFPGIQKPPLHVEGQTVTWKGAHSRFVVSAYDKGKQLRVGGDVFRLEARLCGAILRKHLKGRDWRKFGDVYQIYREVILALPAVPKASTTPSMVTAIAMCGGQELADKVLMSISRNPETIRKYRREIRSAAANLPSNIVWAEIFPAAAPPASVLVEPRRRRPSFQYPARNRGAAWRCWTGQPQFERTETTGSVTIVGRENGSNKATHDKNILEQTNNKQKE